MVHMAISSGQTDNLILGQFSKTADVAMSYPCPCPCFLAIDRSCIFILLILCNQIIHVAPCLSKTPSHPSLPQYTTAKKTFLLNMAVYMKFTDHIHISYFKLNNVYLVYLKAFTIFQRSSSLSGQRSCHMDQT